MPNAWAMIAMLVALLATAIGAYGQEIMPGEVVAQQYCGGCHFVGRNPRPPFGFAPAFTKIARTKAMTRTAIEVFLSTHHEVMPNYVLSPKEIRDVAAYIVSLK